MLFIAIVFRQGRFQSNSVPPSQRNLDPSTSFDTRPERISSIYVHCWSRTPRPPLNDNMSQAHTIRASIRIELFYSKLRLSTSSLSNRLHQAACAFSTTAIHSISTSTSLGKVLTATQLLAGLGVPKD